MGNKQYPRPKEINFPETHHKSMKYERVASREPLANSNGQAFILLKSGNILITYFIADQKKFTLCNYIVILSVPDLKIIQKYVLDNREGDVYYSIPFTLQLNNGKIFAISDRYYFFDKEEIAKGPSKKSEKIDEIFFTSKEYDFYEDWDKKRKNPIYRTFNRFTVSSLIEVKDQKLIYTKVDPIPYHIFFLDASKASSLSKIPLFSYDKILKNGEKRKYELDIIHKSEYYPENIYVIGNRSTLPEKDSFESVLLCLDIDKLLKQEKKNKEPEFVIQVSNSQKIYSICEYDKKYILLDSYKNGIYIIDLDTKQKVAVSVLSLDKKILKSAGIPSFANNVYEYRKAGGGSFYGEMIKLKNGLVFMNGWIIDVREQIILLDFGDYGQKYIATGDYILIDHPDTSIGVFKDAEE